MERWIVPGLSARARSVSLFDLVILTAEHKRFVLWVTTGMGVTALLFSFLLPARYTAEVIILPPQQGPTAAAALANQMGSAGLASLAGGALGLKNTNDVFVGMLKTRTVEDAMIDRFELMKEYRKSRVSDTRRAFEKRIEIDGSGKDGFIHIRIWDHNSVRAAQLANGYVEQLRAISEHLAITEASQRRLFFEGQLQETKDNLVKAEDSLHQTQQKTGLLQLDGQTRALIESAAMLRAQIQAKEVQIESLHSFATDENAQLLQAHRELSGLKVQLAKLSGAGDSEDAGLVLPKGQMSDAGLESLRKLRDVRYFETIFDILSRQFEIAKLDEARQGALIQVVDAAITPDTRSFPKRTFFALVGVALGFIFAIAIVILRDAIRAIEADPGLQERMLRLRTALSIQSLYRGPVKTQ